MVAAPRPGRRRRRWCWRCCGRGRDRPTLWPPSCGVPLHRPKPDVVAASHDWVTRAHVSDPALLRFPTTFTIAATSPVLDQILRRGRGAFQMLDSSVRTQLSEPVTDVERLSFSFSDADHEGLRTRDDLASIDHWKDMALRSGGRPRRA